MAGQDQRRRQALAEAVKARRLQLGRAQGDLAEFGGPSIVTVRQIEKATGPTPSGLTLAGLDRALHWLSGSARRILDGGAAEELPDATAPAAPADSIEQAIQNDTDLHPAARAHLLNQLQLLRLLPPDVVVPVDEQVRNREKARQHQSMTARLVAIEQAQVAPRKGGRKG